MLNSFRRRNSSDSLSTSARWRRSVASRLTKGAQPPPPCPTTTTERPSSPAKDVTRRPARILALRRTRSTRGERRDQQAADSQIPATQAGFATCAQLILRAVVDNLRLSAQRAQRRIKQC